MNFYMYTTGRITYRAVALFQKMTSSFLSMKSLTSIVNMLPPSVPMKNSPESLERQQVVIFFPLQRGGGREGERKDQEEGKEVGKRSQHSGSHSIACRTTGGAIVVNSAPK